MIDAAIKAGADAAFLSGSGPTVAAIMSGAAGDIFLQREKERVDKQVCKLEPFPVVMSGLILEIPCMKPRSFDGTWLQVAEAMLEAAASVSVNGETFITTPTEGGAYVVSAEPKFSDGAIRYPGDV